MRTRHDDIIRQKEYIENPGKGKQKCKLISNLPHNFQIDDVNVVWYGENYTPRKIWHDLKSSKKKERRKKSARALSKHYIYNLKRQKIVIIMCSCSTFYAKFTKVGGERPPYYSTENHYTWLILSETAVTLNILHAFIITSQ